MNEELEYREAQTIDCQLQLHFDNAGWYTVSLRGQTDQILASVIMIPTILFAEMVAGADLSDGAMIPSL